MELFLIILLATILFFLIKENKRLADNLKLSGACTTELTTLKYKYEQSNKFIEEITEANKKLIVELELEKERSDKILHQKKSSESSLGMVTENLIPLLSELPYNPRNLHHLSNPIDYIYFDYDNAEIILIECKTGNSQESKRQKMIKNAIRLGKVYYEELRVDKNGIKIKRAGNKD
jgi:predicted Holliday junction resolvase-like endonuclease